MTNCIGQARLDSNYETRQAFILHKDKSPAQDKTRSYKVAGDEHMEHSTSLEDVNQSVSQSSSRDMAHCRIWQAGRVQGHRGASL